MFEPTSDSDRRVFSAKDPLYPHPPSPEKFHPNRRSFYPHDYGDALKI